jgi:quercetin dioxygenase-like cupin family protein
MLNSHFKIAYNQIDDDVKIKILHHDDSMIMTEFMIQKGAKLPEHVHQSDHSAYLLQGKIRLVADNIISEFVKGDSWCMKKNICHHTEALEDAIVLEVFSHDGDIEGFRIRQSSVQDKI